MTSDPSILQQRIRRLSQALMISGVLNIAVLALLLYWVLKERPPTPYFELKPASHSQQQVPLADMRKCTEALAQLSQCSFPELVARLRNTQIVENGYAERDLALACLATFHHFDLQRALPKNTLLEQKRFFSWQPNSQVAANSIVIYPDLKHDQFETIIQFANTERWPLTSQGLFLLLQTQKAKSEMNNNLIDTFFLTPEFWTVEIFFHRSGLQLAKSELLTMLLEGHWTTLKQFVEQQRQLQDSSEARRHKFLLEYVAAGSPSAALVLLKTDWDFAVKKLDDRQAVDILQVVSFGVPDGERFAKEMLASPRSTNVWKKAAERLYMHAGEPCPDPWDYQMALTRFVPGTKGALAAEQPLKKTVPTPEKVLSVDKAPKETSLPKAKTVVVSPKQRSYVVEEGDSLWKIARRFGVKIEEIKKLNGLNSDNLKPGATLKIPPNKEKK